MLLLSLCGLQRRFEKVYPDTLCEILFVQAGCNRPGLSKHREESNWKDTTDIKIGTDLDIPLSGSVSCWKQCFCSLGCTWCPIKGRKTQALVNIPDETVSSLWIFRKQNETKQTNQQLN